MGVNGVRGTLVDLLGMSLGTQTASRAAMPAMVRVVFPLRYLRAEVCHIAEEAKDIHGGRSVQATPKASRSNDCQNEERWPRLFFEPGFFWHRRNRDRQKNRIDPPSPSGHQSSGRRNAPLEKSRTSYHEAFLSQCRKLVQASASRRGTRCPLRNQVLRICCPADERHRQPLHRP